MKRKQKGKIKKERKRERRVGPIFPNRPTTTQLVRALHPPEALRRHVGPARRSRARPFLSLKSHADDWAPVFRYLRWGKLARPVPLMNGVSVSGRSSLSCGHAVATISRVTGGIGVGVAGARG
jgi:hypothetical protein